MKEIIFVGVKLLPSSNLVVTVVNVELLKWNYYLVVAVVVMILSQCNYYLLLSSCNTIRCVFNILQY